MQVVVLDDWDRVFDASEPVRRLRRLCPVTVYEDSAPDEETLLQRLQGVPVVVAVRERTRFPRRLLERLPDLRLIAQTGGGFAHIDMDAAKSLGIRIAGTPGASASAVAELVFALMLAMHRSLPQMDRRLRQGEWTQPVGLELRGRRLGILGYGGIGRLLPPIARAFGMRTLAWGREGSRQRAEQDGVPFEADLDRFLGAVDVLSVHLRLTAETRGLLTGERLDALPPGAMVINTSRGDVIVEQDLAERLRSGRIAAAGLDVYGQEPLPSGHPFTGLENVVLSCHVGWVTRETYGRFVAQTVANIEAFFAQTGALPESGQF